MRLALDTATFARMHGARGVINIARAADPDVLAFGNKGFAQLWVISLNLCMTQGF